MTQASTIGRRALVTLAVLTQAPALGAQAETAQPSLRARIDSVFSSYSKSSDPGCAVGVYRPGVPAITIGYGAAAIGQGPIRGSTQFEAMSMSKQFTAMAVALLDQDGALSLEDDVRRFVPELQAYGRPVLLRDLIHHTSGLRSVEDLWTLAGDAPSTPHPLSDIIALLARQRRPTTLAGERFAYDNTNYFLLAAVVERVSGMSLRAFTDKRIFRPLGMRRTHFNQDPSASLADRAIGYMPAAGGGFRESMPLYDNVGAHGLLTTADDMAKWEENLRTAKLGGRALVRLLQKPGTLRNGTSTHYGFGLAEDGQSGRNWIQHTGAGAGFRATFLRLASGGLGVAVLCNVSTAPSYSLAHAVARTVLGDVSPAAVSTAAVAPPTPTSLWSPGQLQEVTGVYWDSLAPLVRRVYVQEGRLLMMSVAAPFELRPIGPSRVQVIPAPGTHYIFGIDSTNGTRWMRREAEGVPPITYQRMPPAEAPASDVAAMAGEYYSDELRATYSVVARDGRLLIRRPGTAEIPLEPAFARTFTGPQVIITFPTSSVAPTGFVLSALGVSFLDFTRR